MTNFAIQPYRHDPCITALFVGTGALFAGAAIVGGLALGQIGLLHGQIPHAVSWVMVGGGAFALGVIAILSVSEYKHYHCPPLKPPPNATRIYRDEEENWYAEVSGYDKFPDLKVTYQKTENSWELKFVDIGYGWGKLEEGSVGRQKQRSVITYPVDTFTATNSEIANAFPEKFNATHIWSEWYTERDRVIADLLFVQGDLGTFVYNPVSGEWVKP